MLDISKIRAITLDLDDTLWPVWPTIDRAEIALQQWLANCAPATAALFADPHQRVHLRERAQNRLPHLHHDLSAVRQEMIRLALEQAGEDTNHAKAGFEVFFAERNVVTLFDDALAGLTRLAKRFPVLAVTNGNADIHRVGIGHLFVGSVSAKDVGVGKPDPRIFQAASDTLGLAPELVLHVGDDAHLDVIGAMQSGMQTVWINRSDHLWTHETPPHAEAATMLELCDLVGV
jgi:putative hydrolase of the HAD superfamily